MAWKLLKMVPSFWATPSAGSARNPTKTPRQTDSLPRIDGYEVLEQIGEGGMATVYKARGPDGETVAIKMLSSRMAAKPVFRKRFAQEFLAARKLDHPNIVRSLDFGQSESGTFFVMEFVDAESLGDRIQRQGPLPEAEAVALIGQVALALSYSHEQGVIHRDIKPDNILVTRDGTTLLTDFGLAKHLDGDLDLTAPGQGLGTPNFIAPEQLLHAKGIDQRCDVYGLGATLYMAVTGCCPFAAATLVQTIKKKANNELTLPRQLMPELSKHIEEVIRRAMHPDRGQRLASCEEFLWALNQSSPTAAPKPHRNPSKHPRPQRIPTPALLDVAVPGTRTRIANPACPANAAADWHWFLAGAFALGIAAGLMIAVFR